jgi:RNA polymerase sigma factor (sigma-70 family)
VSPLQVIRGGKAEATASDDRRLSLEELYARYGGSVYGRCQYLLKDRARAEDAMQDVFARALTNMTAFRSEASPLTWLMKIATHHCLNLLRADRAIWRRVFKQDAEAAGEGHGGPQVFEARDAVRKALSRFDVETQAAVVHYHVDGMTLEEVAQLLGRSVPTIRKRLETFAAATGKESLP